MKRRVLNAFLISIATMQLSIASVADQQCENQLQSNNKSFAQDLCAAFTDELKIDEAVAIASLKKAMTVQSENYLELQSPFRNDKITMQRLRQLQYDIRTDMMSKPTKANLKFSVIGQQYYNNFEGLELPNGEFAYIGGLSGLYFDESHGQLLSVTDDRNSSKIFRMVPVQNEHGLLWDFVNVTKVISSKANPRNIKDAEDLAVLDNGTIIVTSEGGIPFSSINQDGTLNATPIRAQSPSAFFGSIKSLFSVNQTTISRGTFRYDWDEVFFENKGIEAFTRKKDSSKEMYFMPELPLLEQGLGPDIPLFMISAKLNGETCVKVKDPVEFQDVQFVGNYKLSNDILSIGTGGVSAMLSIGDEKLIVIERAWDAKNRKVIGRFVLVYLNTSESGKYFRQRTLIEFDEIANKLAPGFRKMDNIEGIAFGPKLNSEEITFVLVSDNNFNSSQVTQLITISVPKDMLR